MSLYGRSLHDHSSIYPSIFALLILMDCQHSLSLLHKHHPHHSPLPLDFRYSPQAVRTRTSDEFRSAKRGIMFSSDVTARGLDYPDVTLVLQVSALCCAVLCCAVLCRTLLYSTILCVLTGLAVVMCRKEERENQTRKDRGVRDVFLSKTPILLSHSLTPS